MSIKRIDTNKLMSKAVISGDTVYLSGLTASDRSQDVKGQCKQILDTIDDYLAQAGTNKSKILAAQIWLTDIGTWADMNEIWVEWIDPANPPARATVEAKLAVPDLYIEIMVTAAL
ncbi:MAG: RidA family protein [Alphaproteobacteria bacterium]|nr:RidA family protein [Alphaproteobacteria bacterium]